MSSLSLSSKFLRRPQQQQQQPQESKESKESSSSSIASKISGLSKELAIPKSIVELKDQVKKGTFSLDSLSALADALRNTDGIDDRKMLLEHAITFVSTLEPGKFAEEAQQKIIRLFYNDLYHPTGTQIGNQFAFRAADGSGNNIEMPDLGKAGTPYARSVQQGQALPQNRLPDPGLVFDTLLKRDGFVKHPAGLSSLMFAWAALVIHTVFRTSHTDVNINETSSYVDLAPLYGNNQQTQDKLRLLDGRGLLLPDVFAEDRLLLLPPSVCAILVLFSRNHNYIAKKLLEINERGTWVDPATVSPDIPAQKVKLIKQDEEIFQIARLVNCGWFGSVVFSDYFSSILGLVRDGNSWSLNPFGEFRDDDHSLFERGRGNVCSVEFNCLYRWHATTSQPDEQWVQEGFKNIFKGKDPTTVTVDDFKAAAATIQVMEPDVSQWTFGKIKRNPDGSFKDEDLANILQDATDHPAGAFRARGTPAIMRIHEVMGINQNRQWGVCSLNDFRKFLGLKPYASFREWNSDPEIADAAEKLYGKIEHLELYVGLQAEEAKPVMEGAGLCPGYTISRAILSDAIALTRGDRFFTHELTPYNLTAWGFTDCQRDPNAFGFGSTLGRLFLRTLPNHFTENSVYTFFPLMTPDSMKTHLTKLGVADQYDLTRPRAKSATQNISDYGVVAEILKQPANWQEPYGLRATRVIRGKGFYPVEGEEVQRKVIGVIAGSTEAVDKIGNYFYETTRKFIEARSASLVGSKEKVVDLVREVFRVVPLHWTAGEIAGFSIKSKDNPDGDYAPDQLFEMLGDIYSFIFLDPEAATIMPLQKKVSGYIEELLDRIKGTGASSGNRVSSFFTKAKKAEKAEQREIAKQFESLGWSSDQIANAILAILVTSTTELSLVITNLVHLYLGSKDEQDIRSIARGKEPEKLIPYIYEALRLDPTFRGVYRNTQVDQLIAHTSIKANSRVFLDIAQANRNEQAFPNSGAVSVTAHRSNPVLHGDGLFRNLGEALTIKILVQVLRALYSYDNVQRAPGDSGVLQRFTDHTQLQLNHTYLNDSQNLSPWATSLTVKYMSP
ncbi:linoleate diol synthase [Pluteus cervinus]|uniref:Linoleate diol synthase n=1 Tax=Pluteus cervinus TaxID=181527 RepID=A0ACD3AIJ9_9AGAR|nr:linoleate diol synthase [Pluteus cervinus]